MTLRYRHSHEPESGVLVVRYAGTITHGGMWQEFSDFEQLLQVQRRAPKRLFDMRGCRFEISTEELMALRDASARFLKPYPIQQAAFVADGDLGFGLIRMYLTHCDEHPVRQSVFRELGPARAYLGMAPASEAGGCTEGGVGAGVETPERS